MVPLNKNQYNTIQYFFHILLPEDFRIGLEWLYLIHSVGVAKELFWRDLIDCFRPN